MRRLEGEGGAGDSEGGGDGREKVVATEGRRWQWLGQEQLSEEVGFLNLYMG
jgi:hypothetical protein